MAGHYASEDSDSIELATNLVVELSALFDAALVRVWLIGPGDRCSGCAMAPSCPDRDRCLHLVASGGLSSRTDGRFSRFPLDAAPVGDVARTHVPLLLREALEASGLAEPAWFAAHRIASFGAWPLVCHGHCDGVMALFSRRVLADEEAGALGAMARLASRLLERADHESGPPPTLAEAQREAIRRALELTGGRVSGPGGAAERLGMKPTTLESRIRRLGLRKPPRRRGPAA